MNDPYVTKLIIVDNGSKNKKEIEEGVKKYGDKVVILRQEKNIGSAGGFARGLAYARGVACDYIFMLDDDNVPEEGAIEKFLELRKLFLNEKVVLVGSRPLLLGNTDIFYKKIITDTSLKFTFFEVFSFAKFFNFLKLFRSTKGLIRGTLIPIVPNESFIYGGAFIPIEAVREAPLPDASLVLYGDDIEYSWGIKKLGYESYACIRPRINDASVTFSDGSHISGLFDPGTEIFKVYYRIRNMVRISIRTTTQAQTILFLNIIVWTSGLCILGMFKYGVNRNYVRRIRIILQAVYGGYEVNYRTPKEAELP
ncbi:hypothetical protein AUJ77_00300 [Candidatus Nomurabacteria bacterium CG1_02_43_90]|uniref:Glycosyltransferase 2-like domain-containing protein n=1 Tax=Candidatus Nomurabacteria bacterium CG1_02_43_90 TaxID=1805281 RepID=A0A1J4V8Z2_9BACT|nr:MAG: hypothetical protein AUJ77_00300 [Candidatus Nomurabacteria bacterium CG1_02_43_90]